MRHVPPAVVLLSLPLFLAATPAATPRAAARAARGVPIAASIPARRLDDATIIAIFDAANTFDIESGALAVQRGRSADVREFGTMLQRDHTMVRQLGRDLATKLHVTPTPPSPNTWQADHDKAMQALRAATPANFDLTFARHEEAFHTAVIDAINATLMPAIQNAELRALVVKVAPAFDGHRRAAAALAQKLSPTR